MPVYFDVDGDCVSNLGYADDEDKRGNLTEAISQLQIAFEVDCDLICLVFASSLSSPKECFL